MKNLTIPHCRETVQKYNVKIVGRDNSCFWLVDF